MLRRIATAVVVAATVSIILAAPASAGLRAGGFTPGECLSDSGPTGEVSVLVMDFCFRPDVIEIEAGQVVRWEAAAESSPHTVTFNRTIDSGELGIFAVKFRRPGSYAYVCAFHPGMAGSVEVRGTPVSGEPLQVVPASDFVPTQPTADQAQLASASTNELLIKIDHVTALLLVLFGLSIGAGSAAAARMIRGG